MYEETVRAVADGAVILDYVSLFAEKRVRAHLRAALPSVAEEELTHVDNNSRQHQV
jgi:hypothetical protein